MNNSSLIIVIDNGKPTIYPDFNTLIGANEPTIRKYLALIDKRNVEFLASMKKEREELARRLKGLDADIAGMESKMNINF